MRYFCTGELREAAKTAEQSDWCAVCVLSSQVYLLPSCSFQPTLLAIKPKPVNKSNTMRGAIVLGNVTRSLLRRRQGADVTKTRAVLGEFYPQSELFAPDICFVSLSASAYG